MLQMRQGRYLSHLPPLPLGWSGGRPWATAQAAQQRTLQIHPRDGYVSPRPSAAFYAYQQPGMLTYRRYLGIGVLLGAEGYLCMVDNEPF